MRRRTRGDGGDRKPSSIGDAIRSYLGGSKIGGDIDQAEVVSVWPQIVGAQIAAVTIARAVTRSGMLVVDVETNAWMNELSLREPEILIAIKQQLPESTVTRIRWQLRRD